MVLQDVITLTRQLINDTNTGGRWSNTALTNLYNQAQQEVIRDVEFPRARLTTSTVLNQQEYPTPELIDVYRVYVAGQLLVPTTKQVLEGHQTQDYDQGLYTGNEPGTQTPGSGGPPGTQGSFTPAWNTQTPLAYPVSNDWGAPAPDAQMWFTGQRPRYYWESGVIGLVPAPAGVYTLCVDCLAVPDDAVNLTDFLIFPASFKRALAWYVVMQCRAADDTQGAEAKVQMATQMYERTMRKLRTDYQRYDGDQPRMPKLRTYRTGRQLGNNRWGGTGWGEW